MAKDFLDTLNKEIQKFKEDWKIRQDFNDILICCLSKELDDEGSYADDTTIDCIEKMTLDRKQSLAENLYRNMLSLYIETEDYEKELRERYKYQNSEIPNKSVDKKENKDDPTIIKNNFTRKFSENKDDPSPVDKKENKDDQINYNKVFNKEFMKDFNSKNVFSLYDEILGEIAGFIQDIKKNE